MLVLATDGCCAGHACDNCKTCQSGRCCRRDNPGYRLPELGDWDGPMYGELGVLNDDGEKVECHCCGEWFIRLPAHIVRVHDVTAEEYKAIFGLEKSQPLISQVSHEKQSKSFRLVMDRATLFTGNRLTAEQLSFYGSRPRRLQTSLAGRRRAGSSEQRSSEQQGIKHGSGSRYRGVVYDGRRHRWRYQIMRLGNTFFGARYLSEEEAARAYDARARELYGDTARLNFPDEKP